MLQFRISNFKEFVDFLNLTDNEYVDVFVQKAKVSLINNSVQIFGKMELTAVADDEDVGKAFRLPRVPTLKLAVPGIIQIDFIESGVKLSVLGNSTLPIWEYEFTRQEVYTGEYVKKIELSESLKDYSGEDLSSVYEVAKLTKTFNSMISVGKGYAVGYINSRIRLLKKVNVNTVFAVNASAFLTLYSFSSIIKKAKNYLAVEREGLVILSTLCLPADNMDFTEMEKQKSAVKCNMELRNVIELMNKIDFKEEFLKFDFKNQAIFLEKNRVRYRVPLLLFDLQCSPKYDLDIIAIPVNIFKLLIAKMGDSFKLSKKPTYLRLECKGLILYL